MIHVKLNNVEIGLSFRHVRRPFTIIHGKKSVNIDVVTRCEIVELVDGKPHLVLATGVSKCSATDNFQKEFGRKQALTQALEKLFPLAFDKPVRAQVWAAYFDRVDPDPLTRSRLHAEGVVDEIKGSWPQSFSQNELRILLAQSYYLGSIGG